MQEKYYQNKVYPFQDDILNLIQKAGVDFYLTGGTALSRCYLGHRYSDDLDLFVNDHPDFKSQCNRVISLFEQSRWESEVTTASKSFVRVMLDNEGLLMKIDFVNDVSFHYGSIESCQIFYRVDNWQNILSNKICALSRMEPKDIADILFIAKRYSFNWESILDEARKKDLWVEALEICKIINDFPIKLLESLKWVVAANMEELSKMIVVLHDDIFYGNMNSLTGNKTS